MYYLYHLFLRTLDALIQQTWISGEDIVTVVKSKEKYNFVQTKYNIEKDFDYFRLRIFRVNGIAAP